MAFHGGGLYYADGDGLVENTTIVYNHTIQPSDANLFPDEIFGVGAQQIITQNIEKIESKFQGKYIFIKKAGKTEKGAITIGWKFELLNVLSGKKSGGIEPTTSFPPSVKTKAFGNL
jgi:hypothetical protein